MLKSKNFIVIYVILSAILIFSMATFFVKKNPQNTEDIFNNNIMKTVEVKISDDEVSWGYATGCFIDESGLILTNKHVVYNKSASANYAFIEVRLADMQEWISASVVQVSDKEDLATIKIDKQNVDCFSLQEKVSNGESIYTIGNPNGFGLSFTSGVVSSNNRNIIYDGETIKTIQTSFVINEGNSGGPVFNNKGELVGIISFRLKDKSNEVIQGVSFVIPTKTIKEFLNG